MVWLHDDPTEGGFALDYPTLAMHAVSRDQSVSSSPCLYCHLNDPDEESTVDELLIVPQRPDASEADVLAERA